MGQNSTPEQTWPDYATEEDDFSDVTGTEYVVHRHLDPARIAATVTAARLDAIAADAGYKMVRAQAVAALRASGMNVRQIEQTLAAGGVSRSQASRDDRRRPERLEPEPAIDCLVEAAWNNEPRTTWDRPAPRRGDRSRGRFHIELELLSAPPSISYEEDMDPSWDDLKENG